MLSHSFAHIQAVLFDLDGTLLDSAPNLAAAANHMRAQQGLPPLPFAEYRPFVGTGARGMLRIALGTREDDPAFDSLREAFFQAYEDCMRTQPSPLFHQVEHLLHRLQQQPLPWGIVTNKIQRFTTPIVRSTPSLSATQALVCGDTTAHTKPHPAPLLAAAQQLGVAAQHCLYVGDDQRDIQAARAAHMGAIAASYGYLGHTSNVQDWQPDAHIDSPLGLLKILNLS